MMNFYLLLGIIFIAVCHVTWADSEVYFISNLYTARDHNSAGALSFELQNNSAVARVRDPLTFVPKYPYLVIMLYPGYVIDDYCRPKGSVATDIAKRGFSGTIVYSGLADGILNNESFVSTLHDAILPAASNKFSVSTIIAFTHHVKEPIPSVVACGLVRRLQDRDLHAAQPVTTRRIVRLLKHPLPGFTLDKKPVSKMDGITDLYSASSHLHVGTILFKLTNNRFVEMFAMSSNEQWDLQNYTATIYQTKDVNPGCFTTGNVVDIGDRFSLDWSRKELTFKLQPMAKTKRKCYTGISRDLMFSGIFTNLNHAYYTVVIQYAEDPPITPNKTIACGVIRPDDDSEDPFLAWAPLGLKPKKISEGARFLSSLHASKIPLPPTVSSKKA